MEQKPAGENPEDITQPPEIILSSSTTGSTESGPNRVCPGCGTVNSPTAVYCAKCGLKLPEVVVQNKKICTGCGAANSPASQYCYKCGLQLPDKPGNSYELRYGGFGERLLAFFINGILSGILIFVILVVIISTKYDAATLDEISANMRATGVVDSRAWSILGIFFLTFLIVTVLYSTISIGVWGRTIGKAALKLKVVKPDGSRVGIIRAFGRSLAYILNYFTLGLSFLIIAFTHKKRGLHDYIADTIVIKT
jgi:Predicted membrane protein/domain